MTTLQAFPIAPAHAPGFTIPEKRRDDIDGHSFIVWAPQTEEQFWAHRPAEDRRRISAKPRDHWAANWSLGKGTSDDWTEEEFGYAEGHSLEDVLHLFDGLSSENHPALDEEVKQAFRKAFES